LKIAGSLLCLQISSITIVSIHDFQSVFYGRLSAFLQDIYYGSNYPQSRVLISHILREQWSKCSLHGSEKVAV